MSGLAGACTQVQGYPGKDLVENVNIGIYSPGPKYDAVGALGRQPNSLKSNNPSHTFSRANRALSHEGVEMVLGSGIMNAPWYAQ